MASEPSEKYVAKRQVYAHALFHGSAAEVATARDELDDYVAKLEAVAADAERLLRAMHDPDFAFAGTANAAEATVIAEMDNLWDDLRGDDGE